VRIHGRLLDDPAHTRPAGGLDYVALMSDLRRVRRADEIDLLDPGHGLRQPFGISVVGDHDGDALCLERLPISVFADHCLEGNLHFGEATDQLASRGSSRPCDQYHRVPMSSSAPSRCSTIYPSGPRREGGRALLHRVSAEVGTLPLPGQRKPDQQVIRLHLRPLSPVQHRLNEVRREQRRLSWPRLAGVGQGRG